MNQTSKTLILKVILPSLLVGGVVGTGVGYLLAKQRALTLSNASAQLAEPHSDRAPPAENVSPTPSPEAALENAATAPSPAALAAYPTPSAEMLRQLGDKNWVRGTIQSKEEDEATGETTTVEVLPDGATANRVYRQDGSLKEEEVTHADGSTQSRDFFENGNVKMSYAKDVNGAQTSIVYDSTGFITQQGTEYSDHTRIYNEYDDHNSVTNTWRVYPDGRAEVYPPRPAEQNEAAEVQEAE